MSKKTRFERSMGELAKEFPVSAQTFRSWHLPCRKVPAERCIKYCELTGHKLWEVRPDIYPIDTEIESVIGYAKAVIEM